MQLYAVVAWVCGHRETKMLPLGWIEYCGDVLYLCGEAWGCSWA